MLAALTALLLSQTLTKPPELIVGEPPTHPEEAAGARGSVTLSIVIDETGLVSRVDVTAAEADADGAASAFSWSALGAATRMVFSPAEIDGKPAAVVITQTLSFEPQLAPPPPPDAPPASSSSSFPVGKLLGRARAAGTVIPLPAHLELSSNRAQEQQQSPRDDAVVVDAGPDGRFAVALGEGPWHVEISASGHEPHVFDVYVAGGAVEVVDVALLPREANTLETVVRAQRSPPPVSRVSLSRAEVTGIPGTYGDALRVVESLPGVARAPLLGGALMVRGGLPADTQVFVEGVPVPTLYHFGGLRSVVNGAFVEELAFMPGGFPARFGNATAGVVDVTTHALHADPFEARLTLDLLDVGFFFGGTAKLSEVSALPDLHVGFAGRRSHTEIPAHAALLVAQAFQAPIPFLPVPSWYDWQAKVEADVSSSLTLTLFAFGAEDQFSFLGEPPPLGFDENGDPINVADVLNAQLGNRFTRVLGRATWKPVTGVSHSLQAFAGQTRRGLLADGVLVPLLAGDFLSPPQDQLDWGLRDDTRLRLLPWIELRAGLDAQQATTRIQRLPSPDQADLDGDGTAEFPLTDVFVSSAALWADAVIELDKLTIIPGVRGEVSSVQLTDDEAIYAGKQTSTVDAAFLDPRVQLRYRFGALMTAKAAFGSFHQRPRLQAAAFDIDGDELLHPQAVHLVAGFESALDDDVTLDAQIYTVRRLALARDRSRIYRPGLNFTPALPAPTSFDSAGYGDTQGFELLLRMKPQRRFFGWISYTFSRTVVALGDRREPEVPFAFDQTHNLILVGKATLPFDITVGARFAFVTGNPSPIPDSVSTAHDINSNTYSPVLSTLRPSRLQPYHRLDLRVERTWVFEWCRVTPFLEVLNTYNWLNPEVVFPGGDFRARELRTLLPGPPVLPLLGLEMTL